MAVVRRGVEGLGAVLRGRARLRPPTSPPAPPREKKMLRNRNMPAGDGVVEGPPAILLNGRARLRRPSPRQKFRNPKMAAICGDVEGAAPLDV